MYSSSFPFFHVWCVCFKVCGVSLISHLSAWSACKFSVLELKSCKRNVFIGPCIPFSSINGCITVNE